MAPQPPQRRWKPNDESTHWEAAPGVAPWRELSDAEFTELNARFGPGLERFFDPIDDEPQKKAASAAAGA